VGAPFTTHKMSSTTPTVKTAIVMEITAWLMRMGAMFDAGGGRGLFNSIGILDETFHLMVCSYAACGARH
jgi:hypothetical protein